MAHTLVYAGERFNLPEHFDLEAAVNEARKLAATKSASPFMEVPLIGGVTIVLEVTPGIPIAMLTDTAPKRAAGF